MAVVTSPLLIYRQVQTLLLPPIIVPPYQLWYSLSFVATTVFILRFHALFDCYVVVIVALHPPLSIVHHQYHRPSFAVPRRVVSPSAMSPP